LVGALPPLGLLAVNLRELAELEAFGAQGRRLVLQAPRPDGGRERLDEDLVPLESQHRNVEGPEMLWRPGIDLRRRVECGRRRLRFRDVAERGAKRERE